MRELAGEPLIGVSPTDPYGAIIAGPFREAGLDYRLAIRGRFAQTVVSLVRHGLGVAVIDEFSVAGVYMPGLVRLPLEERVPIRVFAAQKDGREAVEPLPLRQRPAARRTARAVSSRPWKL